MAPYFTNDVADMSTLGGSFESEESFLAELENDGLEATDIWLENWAESSKISADERVQRQHLMALLLSYPILKSTDGTIKVMHDVILKGHDKITSLPEGISFGGDLSLIDCLNLKSFPSSLHVDGDMKVAFCPKLTHFQTRLFVKGSLTFTNMNGLLRLPQGLHVEKNVTITHCPNLLRLDANAFVDGNLCVEHCPLLTELGPLFVTRGDIHISCCRAFAQLPERLYVRGSLWLTGCPAFQHLPENIVVLGNLFLIRLVRLRGLPKELQIGGHIRLWLLRLENISDNIFQLGKTDLGLRRIIDLRYTELPFNVYSRIGNYEETTQCFLFDKSDNDYAYPEKDLQFWVNFWLLEHEKNSLVSLSDVNTLKWLLKPYSQKQLCLFLSRLADTPDYKSKKTHYEFKQKVWLLIQCLEKHHSLRRIVLQEIGAAHIGGINDVILRFNRLEVLTRIYLGLSLSPSLNQLRSLAVGTLRKSLIAKFVERRCIEIAKKYSRHGKLFCRDVDLQLSYEIALQEKYLLPGTAKSMCNPIEISEQEIQEISHYIDYHFTNVKMVEQFFQQWDRWIEVMFKS